MFPLLNCCVEAAVNRLGKFLVCLVPGGTALIEVVEFGTDVWERWKKQKPAEEARREELQALAHASAERVAAAVQAAIQAEAAGQPAAVKRKLTTYLIQVQVAVHRTLCRPADLEGRSADLRLNNAEDLLPFLPPELPHFEPGELDPPSVAEGPLASGATPIRFACPVCMTAMKAPAQKAGQKLNCPKCGQRIQIPPPPRGTILAVSLPPQEPILDRHRPTRPGVPGWVWLAGGVAAVIVAVMLVVVVVLAVRNGSRPKSPEDPPLATKGPTGDDRPKDADKAKDTDPDRKKDKTDTPEKPAPLPRLTAFPTLSLPERGAAAMQVKVERQGYAGPIKVQVENLPPGVTCQRSATIPAGESALRLEFRTDGTAAEGTATVEVIATADTQTADRQKLSLVLPRVVSEKQPESPRPTTWRSLASMPTARSLLAAVTGPEGRIYAIGGQNASGGLDTVEVYDPSTNKWTAVAPMPTARIHHAATLGPDNLIYAIGGVSSVPNIVEAYNPRSNKWTAVAPIPTARHGLAAVTGPDGRIYAIGGNGQSVSLNTVEAYNPTTNTWATVANMPTARVYLAAAMGPDGRIYAIGGFVERDGNRLNTVEAYDTKTNTWTSVASMTTARNAHAAATGPDGRIYAIGGHTVGGMPNTVEAYNPSTNTWTPVTSIPTVRGQLAATTGRDGRIYVIGVARVRAAVGDGDVGPVAGRTGRPVGLRGGVRAGDGSGASGAGRRRRVRHGGQ